jgi:anti-sigma B factor antagonist
VTAEPSFSVSQVADSDGVTVTLRGELDLLAAPQVAETLRGHVEAGRHQTLDLSDVTFIDSSGLAAIVTSAQTQEDRAQVTIRRSRHPQPNHLFKLTAMATLFTIEPEEEATGPTPGSSAEEPGAASALN